MPQMDQEDFKFPDEQEAEKAKPEKDDDFNLEIEIEDDTPAEDRGKTPMPKPLVEELEKDELDQYDDNVKIRLKQMRKVWHDERREKEAAMREQQEAIELAKRLLNENTRIRSLLSAGEKEFVNTAKNAAETELKSAKKEWQEAYESGDSERILKAQEELQLAQLKLLQVKNYKPAEETPLQQPQPVVQTPQYQAPPPVPRPDPKAAAWQERNPWFGQNKRMSAYALGVHQDLQDQGVEIGSDDYYGALDKEMRKRFPETFGQQEVEQPSREQQRSKPATVVAPATRSTASNKVKLVQTELSLAKKLGLTQEQYALEKLKLKRLEAQNG